MGGPGEGSCSDGGHGYNSIKKYYYDRTREPVDRTVGRLCVKRDEKTVITNHCVHTSRPCTTRVSRFLSPAFPPPTPTAHLRGETFRACKLFISKTTTARFFLLSPAAFCRPSSKLAAHVGVCVRVTIMFCSHEISKIVHTTQTRIYRTAGGDFVKNFRKFVLFFSYRTSVTETRCRFSKIVATMYLFCI